MRIVEFIPPFEGLRGNVSGRQDLLYAENNNKAFFAPLGQRNYARNYSPRIICARVAGTNRGYFIVRTRTAFNTSPRAMKAISLLGGAGALYSSLLRNKSSLAYNKILAQYIELQAIGMTSSFRKYVMDTFRTMLINYAPSITFTGPRADAQTVLNPWYGVGQTEGVTISTAMLVKFWMYLNRDAIQFTVDGNKGIASVGDTFSTIIDNGYNVLNLTAREVERNEYICMGARYLKDPNGEYVIATHGVIANGAYTTTDVEP